MIEAEEEKRVGGEYRLVERRDDSIDRGEDLVGEKMGVVEFHAPEPAFKRAHVAPHGVGDTVMDSD